SPASARHRWQYLLSQVHGLQSFLSRGTAFGAFEEPFEVPHVHEYASSVHADALLEHGFDGSERRRRKMAFLLEALHDPVSGACGDDRTALHSDVKRVRYRADGPLDAFLLSHKRRADQDERSHVDVLSPEERYRPLEVVERHAFV